MAATALVLLTACGDDTPEPVAPEPEPVAAVSVIPDGAALVAGTGLPLHAVLTNESGDTLDNREVSWVSSETVHKMAVSSRCR